MIEHTEAFTNLPGSLDWKLNQTIGLIWKITWRVHHKTYYHLSRWLSIMALIALKWSIKTKRSPRNRFSRRPGLKASTGRPPGGSNLLFALSRREIGMLNMDSGGFNGGRLLGLIESFVWSMFGCFYSF